MGVDGDQFSTKGGISEADAIVSQARKQLGDSGETVEKVVADMIMEELEPGPELSAEALKTAQKSN